jgi:HSP20 family molecular chaperone IbpA
MLLTSSMLTDFFNDDFAIRKMNQTKKDETRRDFITHDDDGATLKLKVPGFNKKSIDISVDSETLTIEGKTEDDSFTKKYSVDNKFDFDSIDAKVVDGLLTLTLPYTADVKPRKIKVN